jgi:hypothetical protein
MQRIAALGLVAALAGQPGCAHRQLTNQQFAAGVVAVTAVVGVLVLYGRVTDCERHGACSRTAQP